MKVLKDYILFTYKELTPRIKTWLILLKNAQLEKPFYKELNVNKAELKILKYSDDVIITMGGNTEIIHPYYEKDFYEELLLSNNYNPVNFGKIEFKYGNEEYERVLAEIDATDNFEEPERQVDEEYEVLF